MAVRVPSKRQTLLAYLKAGLAMVHVDARRPGVSVPTRYTQDAHLRLNLSYRYSIPDLQIGDFEVKATLSFGGVPFLCVLPWDAIFGITSAANGDGQVWPEDLPVEVMQTMAQKHGHEQTSPADEMLPVAELPRPRPALSAVQGTPEEGSAPEGGSSKAPDGAPRRHLRLVR
jgi:stringent starvation protein B